MMFVIVECSLRHGKFYSSCVHFTLDDLLNVIMCFITAWHSWSFLFVYIYISDSLTDSTVHTVFWT